MNSDEPRRGLALIQRIGLGVIFLLAAGAKTTDPVRFSRQIEAFGAALLGGWNDWLLPAAGIVAGMVITVEWILGAMLTAGWQHRRAAVGAVTLLAVFLTVLIVGRVTGSMKECGCFGVLGNVSIIEDAVLLFLAATLVMRLKPRSESTQDITDYPPKGTVSNRAGFAGILLLGIGLFFGCQWWIPSWAALRVGSALPESLRFEKFAIHDPLALWALDPNCAECVEKTAALNCLNRRYPVVAITDASPGRIDEYRGDFAPEFAVRQVSTPLLRRLGLPMGSVAICNQASVKEIVRLNRVDLGSKAVVSADRNH